jgi:hypothetical protein
VHSGCSPETDSDILDSTLFDRDEFAKQHLGTEGRLDSNKCSTTIAAIAKVVYKNFKTALITSTIFKQLIIIQFIDNRRSSSTKDQPGLKANC